MRTAEWLLVDANIVKLSLVEDLIDEGRQPTTIWVIDKHGPVQKALTEEWP